MKSIAVKINMFKKQKITGLYNKKGVKFVFSLHLGEKINTIAMQK